MNNYHFFLILFLSLGFYFLSNYLVKIKKISLITNRRFWNIILLISFLTSGILGLVLAIFIELKWSILWYQSVLWIHVETGIIMAIIGIFHTIWHLSYYLSLLKKN